MDNYSNQYTNTKNLIYLYLLHKEIKHPKKKQDDSEVEQVIYFIRKNILDIYKDLCQYNDINEFFENNKNILNDITLNKLNESNIINIINQIPEDIIKKIENFSEKYLLKILKREENNEWKYKYFLKASNNKSNKSIKYLDDFEMIDKNLKNFFQKKKCKVLKGNYVVGNEGIFINILHNIYEIGSFDQYGNFILYYLLDEKEIGNFNNFRNALINEGVDSIINKIKEGKNKAYIKYNIFINKCRSTFSFYIINDIISDKIQNILVNTEDNNINNITQADANNINNLIETSTNDINGSINGSINESIIDNDLIMRDSNNKKYEIIDKLKCLILLSIYQKIINKNKTNILKVFLLNKKYLNQFYFNEVDELVNNNNIIKKIIDNKNVKDLSLKLLGDNLVNDEQFSKMINKYSKNKNIHIPHIYEGEYFGLSNLKNIKIFKSFVIINEELSKNMKDHFMIKFEQPYISYISINEKDILFVNDNQHTIFIGNLNYDDHTYNIDYILSFENQQNLMDEIKIIINKEYNDYINDKLIFDKYKKIENIFPIFSKTDTLRIIGYGYKYNNEVDYSNVIDYTKYLNNEILTNNISLFIHYENIKNKKSKNLEKYYLINSEYMENIKIENNYKLLYDYLDENIKKIKILDDNKKNIYSLLKTIPIKFLENYFSNNFNDNNNKSQFNTTVEPLMISINYFDNIFKKQSSLYIYNKFEIIGKEIMNSFIGINENINYLCECFFEKGKIIINMPNNLNNKIISLIGSLDNYYNFFKLEYIFIYNNEKDRTNHFNNIFGKLDKYLENYNCIKIMLQ